MQNSVALVLYENFSTRLSALAEEMPVWILSSHLNDQAVQAARPHLSQGWLTTLNGKAGEDPDCLLTRALYAIDEHHGEESQPVPYNTLFVYGTSRQPSLELMSELGFKTVSSTGDGYKLVK